MENKNEYYNLKQLEKITNLKYRQLQNRVKKLKEDKSLLFKKKNKWYIHKSLINKFQRQRWPIEFNLFVSISSKHNLTKEYWKQIILKINNEIIENLDKYSRTKYVIEKNKNGINHLHFIIGFKNKQLIKKLLAKNDYLIGNDMNILVKDIYEKRGLVEYLNKENKLSLIKKKKIQYPPK